MFLANRPPKLRLHHVGVVVEKVEESARILSAIGLCDRTIPKPDPIQQVSASFVRAGGEDGPFIELLEPTTEVSPISKFLRNRGGGLHHLCFEVDDIEAASEFFKSQGIESVVAPVECIGFDLSFNTSGGKPSKLAFFVIPGRLLIELYEKGSNA